MYRSSLSSAASRRLEAIHAVHDTGHALDGSVRHCGEAVVAHVNPKVKPQHYFAVVDQRQLLLAPLVQGGNAAGAYQQRKQTLPRRARIESSGNGDRSTSPSKKKKTKNEEKASRLGNSNEEEEPTGCNHASAGEAMVCEKRQELGLRVVKTREEWPTDAVIELGLADIREIVVYTFDGTRRRGLREIDNYEFEDDVIDACAMRVRLLFESRPTIELVTWERNSRLSSELRSAHVTALHREHMGIEASRIVCRTKHNREAEAHSIVRDLEATVWARSRRFDEIPAILQHCADFEDLVLVDIDLKKAFFLSQKLPWTFFSWLEDLTTDLDAVRDRTLQLSLAARALAGLRVVLAALHDSRFIKERYALLNLHGRALMGLIDLLIADHYNYKELRDDRPLIERDPEWFLSREERIELRNLTPMPEKGPTFSELFEKFVWPWEEEETATTTPSGPRPNDDDDNRRNDDDRRNEDDRRNDDAESRAAREAESRASTSASNTTSSALYQACARHVAKTKSKRRGSPPSTERTKPTAKTPREISTTSASPLPGPTKATHTPPTTAPTPGPTKATHTPPTTAQTVPERHFVRDPACGAAYLDVECKKVLVPKAAAGKPTRKRDGAVFAQLMDAQICLLKSLDELSSFRHADFEELPARISEPAVGRIQVMAVVQLLLKIGMNDAARFIRSVIERCLGLALMLSHQGSALAHPQRPVGVLHPPLAFASHAQFLVHILKAHHNLRELAMSESEMEINDLLQHPDFYTNLDSSPLIKLGRNYLQEATILVLQVQQDLEQCNCLRD